MRLNLPNYLRLRRSQAAEVSTGDAQKLARLVSRELFVKPAKEKSLPGLRVESPGATELGRKA
jgi:hypothetical protein